MWPDRVSNSRPLALGSDALPTALRGPAVTQVTTKKFLLPLQRATTQAGMIYPCWSGSPLKILV